MSDITAHAATVLLMFVILPAWILAGLADYVCHRASHIAETSGTPESLLHFAQFGVIGVPTVLAMLLQINAAFFILAAGAIVLHHAVAYADLRYANRTREVWPVEQMVHSFLEITPIAAFVLLAALHWPELLALAGYPASPDSFAFRLKDHPLPFWYIGSAIGAAALFNALPYCEELFRCVKHRSLKPHAAPSAAKTPAMYRVANPRD